MSNELIEKELDKYVQTYISANKAIEDVPLRNRPGWQMLIEQAKKALPDLRYNTVQLIIPDRINGVIANGNVSSIKKIAKFVSSHEGLVIDASKLYVGMAERANASFGQSKEMERNWSVTQQLLFIQALTEEARNLYFDSIDEMPEMGAGFLCKTLDMAINYVRNSVRNSSLRDNLQLANIRKLIFDFVLEQYEAKDEFPENKINVLVINAVTAEYEAIKTLFSTTKVYSAQPNLEVNAAAVAEIFKN